MRQRLHPSSEAMERCVQLQQDEVFQMFNQPRFSTNPRRIQPVAVARVMPHRPTGAVGVGIDLAVRIEVIEVIECRARGFTTQSLIQINTDGSLVASLLFQENDDATAESASNNSFVLFLPILIYFVHEHGR